MPPLSTERTAAVLPVPPIATYGGWGYITLSVRPRPVISPSFWPARPSPPVMPPVPASSVPTNPPYPSPRPPRPPTSAPPGPEPPGLPKPPASAPLLPPMTVSPPPPKARVPVPPMPRPPVLYHLSPGLQCHKGLPNFVRANSSHARICCSSCTEHSPASKSTTSYRLAGHSWASKPLSPE
jgi:hypothetical protein